MLRQRQMRLVTNLNEQLSRQINSKERTISDQFQISSHMTRFDKSVNDNKNKRQQELYVNGENLNEN